MINKRIMLGIFQYARSSINAYITGANIWTYENHQHSGRKLSHSWFLIDTQIDIWIPANMFDFFFVHQWNIRSNDLKRSSLNGLVGKIGRSITIWNNCDEFFFRNGMDEKDSKLRGSALVALGKLGQKLPEAVTKDMAIIQMLFNAMETVIIIF